MITVEEIKKKVENKRSDYLKAKIQGTFLFPLSLNAAKGSIHDDFTRREKDLERLYELSKDGIGKGYTLVTKCKESRVMGKQTVISDILIESEADFLFLLQAEERGSLFEKNLELLRTTFPDKDLTSWLLAKKLDIFLHWNSLEGLWFCQIARFLADNPNCGLFARELKTGAPTKFLENNLALIKSLVETLRPLEDGEDDYTKLGLRKKESLIKIRSGREFEIRQDGRSYGFTTMIILNPETFRKFSFFAKRIFIVENETVFFTFPLQEGDLCLYAGGYGILSCKSSRLLAGTPLHYFGDLDEHGFAILDKFRSLYPHVQSFCMDRETLADHENYRVKGKSYKGIYNHLTQEEQKTLELLKKQENKNLLEQERISTPYFMKRLQSLTKG